MNLLQSTIIINENIVLEVQKKIKKVKTLRFQRQVKEK